MASTKEEGGDEKPNQNRENGVKATLCKGQLYFSSALKAQARNPRCFGVSRSGIISQDLLKTKERARARNIFQQGGIATSKDPQNLSVNHAKNGGHFKYACLGYSVYFDGKGKESFLASAELPTCAGLEFLVEKVPVNKRAPASTPAPVKVHNKEDKWEAPLPPRQKPAHSVEDDFLSRFTRSATLVALGVARNMYRLGKYVSENIDDILHPDRRRPK
ncbi:Altered inheritance of mitochondria protein [Quillaja saponaria]|uniref:Altered inheritance of mitochondria protein n=1 Tax=Quillaja saponaria TaxID=32244 RepID=A0AAD7PFE3_QUISA|nr:Altered inheritance of mitochondria protein [Quillaja saponaria]KAJ7953083.1 Altered inheritance of mitochondria protein [Quillaja saponaria]